MNLQVNTQSAHTALMLKILLATDGTVMVCGSLKHWTVYVEEYPKERDRLFTMQQLNNGRIPRNSIILYDLEALQRIKAVVESLEQKADDLKEDPAEARLNKAERTNDAYYRILCGDLKRHLDGVTTEGNPLSASYIRDTYDKLKKAKSKIRRSK